MSTYQEKEEKNLTIEIDVESKMACDDAIFVAGYNRRRKRACNAMAAAPASANGKKNGKNKTGALGGDERAPLPSIRRILSLRKDIMWRLVIGFIGLCKNHFSIL